MTELDRWVYFGGWLQLSLLAASAIVPFVFDWHGELARLSPFLRRLFWVYGAFIVIMIIGFGLLAIGHASALAGGSPLGRSVCAFMALFWLARFGVQLFVFDVTPYVRSPFLKAGYHVLTLIFFYLVVVFGAVALGATT
jgi:hypothetical protein